MGVFDKLLNAIRINEDEDYDDEEFYDDEDEETDADADIEEKPKKSFFSRIKRKKDEDDYDDFDEEESEPAKPEKSFLVSEEPKQPVKRIEKKPAKVKTVSKVTPMRRRSGNNMEVCVIKPVSMEDTREIADTLLSGCTVVLNLEGINVELAQRIIDFTSGACYSIDGSLQKVSSYIFILTPSSVDISGDITDILNNALPSMRSNI